MEGHKSKMMTMLVAEINRMNEENQNLNSMLNHMISNHDNLEKQIRSLVQEKQQLTGVDTIQIVNPHHKSEDKFNLRILSPRSAEIESNGAVSHQSYHSSDCHDRVREMEGKTHKFMDDMQLPSKKRKTNYVQLDQSQNGMIINSSINDSPAVVSHQSYHSSDCHGRVWEMEGKKSKFMDDMLLPSKKRKINYVQLDQIHNVMIDSSMDDSLICDEPPKKKHSRLNKGSSQEMAAAPKKIVSVRTRTNVSVISDGCQWRKYGQKMTRNNTQPRSYYRCAMAPSCPVKRQIQRCAEDPTIVVTTYEGEHTHSLSPLARALLQAGSSNQVIGEGLDRANSVAANKLIPLSTGIASISTSSPFPTITLDLTDNQPTPRLQVNPPNPGLHMQPHLTAGSFQHSTPLPNNIGHVLDLNQLDHPSIMDSVASIKADPNFTAALAVAIAGSMLKLGTPIEGMPKYSPATHYTDGSTLKACV